MDPEHYKEWQQRLGEEARAQLEGWPTSGGLPEWQAIILPSFGDSISYSLMVPGPDGGGPTGVRRVWRQDLDLAKFEAPPIRLRYGPRLTPTIEERSAPLDPDRVADLLARASALQVPARAPLKSIGADGTAYVLMFGELFLASRFEWWEQPPPGWEGLRDLFQETSNLIESALA